MSDWLVGGMLAFFTSTVAIAVLLYFESKRRYQAELQVRLLSNDKLALTVENKSLRSMQTALQAIISRNNQKIADLEEKIAEQDPNILLDSLFVPEKQ